MYKASKQGIFTSGLRLLDLKSLNKCHRVKIFFFKYIFLSEAETFCERCSFYSN